MATLKKKSPSIRPGLVENKKATNSDRSMTELTETNEKTRTIFRGDIHKLLKRKRSPSPQSTSIKDAEQQTQMTPEDFMYNAQRYVESIPLRGYLEGDEEAKLNKILENMEVDRMKIACEEGKPLHPKCNAIRNKIRDLFMDNTWHYVQSIKLRGALEPADKAKLNKILENMKVDRMKFACEEGKPLHPKCNAIHNKIRDLLERWREPILGGKRTRRSKTMRKTKRSSRKNKK
jgi:hypothetical protein